MVAPVFGPFNVFERFEKYYRHRVRYKQRAPHTVASPYTLVQGFQTKATGNLADPGHTPESFSEGLRSQALSSTAANQARILAYEKLKNQISDRASMAENLFEYEKTLKVIESRALQLFKFTQAIRRGHLGHAAQILRSPEPRKRHPVKQSASNWLEYHLGIAPVIGDIYSAIDVLQSPIKNVRCRARASVDPYVYEDFKSSSSFSVGRRIQKVTALSVQYRCDVAVSNPNLFLANALGIINPAVVAWQLIPLSFVVDWFVNVEQFLGTASDFWGLTVLNATTTTKWSGTYFESWNNYGWVLSHESSGMDRGLGVSLPSLALRPFKLPSWQRGLTAVSLLVGGLKSLH